MTSIPLHERLRLPVSMSMFARQSDMLRALLQERAEAADLIEEMLETLKALSASIFAPNDERSPDLAAAVEKTVAAISKAEGCLSHQNPYKTGDA